MKPVRNKLATLTGMLRSVLSTSRHMRSAQQSRNHSCCQQVHSQTPTHLGARQRHQQVQADLATHEHIHLQTDLVIIWHHVKQGAAPLALLHIALAHVVLLGVAGHLCGGARRHIMPRDAPPIALQHMTAHVMVLLQDKLPAGSCCEQPLHCPAACGAQLRGPNDTS